MPREVFADEIERYLSTLDGVSSVRVLAGPGGDVSFVYVTTDAASDTRGLRGGVVAALQAHFGIPIDEWRVRITQLRAGAQPSEIPHFRVGRLEETAAGNDLAVMIKLQWRQGADHRTAVGKARARGGAAGRSRALAAATIAAVRDALQVGHSELALERVGSVTFLDRPVILVAVSAAIDKQTRTFVGAAFDQAPPDPASEPAVTAALDAVTRWLVQGAFAAEGARRLDRRDRLEAMRHFVLDAAAEPASVLPAEGTGLRDIPAQEDAPSRPRPQLPGRGDASAPPAAGPSPRNATFGEGSQVSAAGDAAEPASELGVDAPFDEPAPAPESLESIRLPATLSRVAPVRPLPPRRAAMMRNGEVASGQVPPERVAPDVAESVTGGPAAAGSAATGSPAEGMRARPPLAAARADDSGAGPAGPSPAGADPMPRYRAVEMLSGLKGAPTKEGTSMGLQHDTTEAGSGPRAARAAGVEDAFYRSLVADRTPVHLRCRDGYEVPHAIVRDAGTYALLVETEEGLELFFKHAIISIRVLPKTAPQA